MTANGNLPGLLRTADEVMRRRGGEFSETHAALVQTLFDHTADERQRTILETERRRLRRSA